MLLRSAFPNAGWAVWVSDRLGPQSVWFYVISGAMIFFFSYFWVATMFQPSEIAENLKRSGGYVPGVRPGKPTADFLDFTMTRLTFAAVHSSSLRFPRQSTRTVAPISGRSAPPPESWATRSHQAPSSSTSRRSTLG